MAFSLLMFLLTLCLIHVFMSSVIPAATVATSQMVYNPTHISFLNSVTRPAPGFAESLKIVNSSSESGG